MKHEKLIKSIFDTVVEMYTQIDYDQWFKHDNYRYSLIRKIREKCGILWREELIISVVNNMSLEPQPCLFIVDDREYGLVKCKQYLEGESKVVSRCLAELSIRERMNECVYFKPLLEKKIGIAGERFEKGQTYMITKNITLDELKNLKF
jgi:hypothetical protein